MTYFLANRDKTNLVEKSSKGLLTLDRLFDLLILIFFIVIVGLNTDNLDYINYQNNYERLNWMKGTEYLFYAFQQLFRYFGCSFQQFKFFIALFSFILLHIFVKRTKCNSRFFYLLYILYPFFLDTVEIRFFLGMTIWLNGVVFLIKGNRGSRLLYVVFTLCALLCQSTFFVFLPLVLFPRKKNVTLFVMIFLAIASVSLTLMTFSSSLSIGITNFLFDIYERIFGFDVRFSYTEEIYTNNGYFLFLFENIIVLVIMLYFYLLRSSSDNCINYKFDCAKFSVILCLYLLCFMPLFRINGQFTRIVQAAMPFFHASFLLSLPSKRNVTKTTQFFKLFYISYVLFLFFYVLAAKHFQDIIVKLFENNVLWG